MSFTEQVVDSIGYRGHFDPNFHLDEEIAQILEQTFKNTAAKSMQEPFFSIRQRVCSLAQTFAADQSAEAFSYQCLADSHTFLQACLKEREVKEQYMTLTVGDISFDGKKLFGTSRQTLQQAVETGISTRDTPKFHVWLTLVDMTVIDLTIALYLIKTEHIEPPTSDDQWLTVWRPERKGRLDYHPMLIDDKFLSRLQRPAH